ncbi:hypothetical protein P4E94_03680 [Pontiellaceae bacterium B12219]|nr:hypothetical protein [Pontiellaceae bacterium B12219]
MKTFGPILLITALLFSACSPKPEKQHTAFSEPVYSKQYRHGTATVILSLSETNIPVAGQIRMMLDVHTPPNTEISVPDLGSFIDSFRVADGYAEPLQSLPNGKQLYRRVWQLNPGPAGDCIFQPLEIIAGADSVQTEPIRIHVESILPDGFDALEIKDIAAPVELLPEQKKTRHTVYTALGILLALLLIPFIFRRKRPKPEIVLLPHEIALQSLENLPEDPIERIHELNRILRLFCEARFQVPTLGKTLDEIIEKLPKPILLGQRYPLEKYLTASDQARFSHAFPPEFSEEMERYIRKFIHKNKVDPCD